MPQCELVIRMIGFGFSHNEMVRSISRALGLFQGAALHTMQAFHYLFMSHVGTQNFVERKRKGDKFHRDV